MFLLEVLMLLDGFVSLAPRRAGPKCPFILLVTLDSCPAHINAAKLNQWGHKTGA